MMKGLFAILSEPRPWNGRNRNTDVEQWFKTEQLGPHVKELADTVSRERKRWNFNAPPRYR